MEKKRFKDFIRNIRILPCHGKGKWPSSAWSKRLKTGMDPICCVGGNLQCACSLSVVDQIGLSFHTTRTSGISGVPGPSAISLLGFPIGLSNLGNTCFVCSTSTVLH